MLLGESNFEGDDSGNDNDDWNSAAKSPSALLGNTSIIRLTSGLRQAADETRAVATGACPPTEWTGVRLYGVTGGRTRPSGVQSSLCESPVGFQYTLAGAQELHSDGEF